MSVEYPPWPHFSEDEIKAVEAVLRSGKVNYWTGPENRLFEEEFAVAVGCDRAIACWSFCQDKIMTTGGEGGMITLNDEDLWEEAWSLKDRGQNGGSSEGGGKVAVGNMNSNLNMPESG